MTLDEYQDFVKTCPTFNDPALVMLLEAGEAIQHVLKDRRGGTRRKPVDRDKLAEELGDAGWGLVKVASEYGLSFQSILEGNVAKLTGRHF